MNYTLCKDMKYNENVKAVYFDGTSSAISKLQGLLSGSNQFNMNTLHTKIGWWAIRYNDGSIVWKKNKCFNTNYKIMNN